MHKIIRTANRLPSQNFTHHLAFYVNYFKPEKSKLSVCIVQRNEKISLKIKKQGEEMENRLEESQTRESRETLKLSSMEILKPNRKYFITLTLTALMNS